MASYSAATTNRTARMSSESVSFLSSFRPENGDPNSGMTAPPGSALHTLLKHRLQQAQRESAHTRDYVKSTCCTLCTTCFGGGLGDMGVRACFVNWVLAPGRPFNATKPARACVCHIHNKNG